MKNILIYLQLTILFPAISFADGRIAEIWTQPAIFKADEPVSWFFDVTGTALEGVSEGIYMWSWYPTEPDEGNWTNSSDFTALTHVEGNIWRLDLVPTEYYGIEASEIVEFYGLLKNDNGSKFTDAFAPDQIPPNQIQLYSLSSIEGNGVMEYMPREVFGHRQVSIVINVNNTWSGCESAATQGELAEAESVHIIAGLNNREYSVALIPDNLEITKLDSLGNGVYRFDFIPEVYFNVPDDYDYSELEFIFTNPDSTLVGADVNCTLFTIPVSDPPEIIPPEMILFPQKISASDILTLIRTNNEAGVAELTYSIYAEGTRVAQGSMTGTSLALKAHINLIDVLKDYPDLESIRLEIRDNNERSILNTTIQLVNLDH